MLTPAGENRSRGKLYVCATPIGNLEDITLRVLRVLREVDLIAAEDTRHTRKLLAHYDIHTPLNSYHEHNKRDKGEYLLEQLANGSNLALVSDAGTPGIADPGEDLIRKCIARQIEVVVLPGPSAILPALVVSGLPTGRFVFEGFLPRLARVRKQFLAGLAGEPRVMVFYEAPHRLKASLRDLAAVLGEARLVAVCRELTKKFEEVFRGTLAEACRHFDDKPVRGELVLVVQGHTAGTESGAVSTDPGAARDHLSEAGSVQTIGREVAEELRRGTGRSEALRQVAARRGLAKKTVYRIFEQYKNDVTSAAATSADSAASGEASVPGGAASGAVRSDSPEPEKGCNDHSE